MSSDLCGGKIGGHVSSDLCGGKIGGHVSSDLCGGKIGGHVSGDLCGGTNDRRKIAWPRGFPRVKLEWIE